MSKLELHVKGITGDTTLIKCSDDIIVYDLKKLISNDEPYMLILLCDSTELNDEQFLNQTNIENGGTIYYLIKLNREVEILLEIKRKMNINLNWNRNIELSEWRGIEINNENDSKFKAINLNLSNDELTGEIPKEIGKLINLRGLYLNNNQLTGEIPKEIGKLTNLQDLYLNNNKLTGEIPKEIGKLINLQWLYLYNNKLTGEIPKEIGKLINLQHLYLNDNKLTGEIPKEIGKLTNLKHLYLYNNKFTGEIPKEIQQMKFTSFPINLNFFRNTTQIDSYYNFDTIFD